jgi:hypothetical protein
VNISPERMSNKNAFEVITLENGLGSPLGIVERVHGSPASF